MISQMQAMAHSSLPWQWILQHILDIKDIGTPILKEIMTYIPHIQKNSGLEKRIALRYLEEVIALGRVDAQAIPLVVALMEESWKAEAHISNISTKGDLVLRVQTEAVLTHLRRKPRNWKGFSEALDHIFPEESEDARIVERRKELLILSQTQDQETYCWEILEHHSIDDLRHDLLEFIIVEKANLEHTFLSELLQDVVDGKYPLPKALDSQCLMKTNDNNLDLLATGQQRKDVGSDDTTVLCDRNIHDEAEEAVDSKHEHPALPQKSKVDTRKRGTTDRSKPVNPVVEKSLSTHSIEQRELVKETCRPEEEFIIRLTQRYEDNTVKSSCPLNIVEDCTLRSCANDECDRIVETRVLEGQDDSLNLDLLDVGSDGHKELCFKCNKAAGTLLKCDGCPIAVHSKCLDSNSNSLIVQEFFCPLCMQKKAAAALTRALQEEREARQRVADFIASAHANKACQSLGGRCTFSLGTEETDCRTKNTADLDVHVTETGLEKPSFPEPQMQEAKEALPKEPICVDIEMTCEANADARSPKAKDTVHMSQSQIQEEDGDGHDGDVEEGSGDSKIADESHIGKEKTSRKLESSKDIYERLNKRRILRGNRLIPGMRRKRLAWTKAEEDILKAGVKKFSHGNGEWGFQWTRILEYGEGTFHPSRTDVDLKDKWRNLAKARL